MQDQTVPETTERQMCAAAQADVYCSPRCFGSRGRDCENPLPTPAAEPASPAYSCDGCGRTFPEPPQMWRDRCGWCRWGTPDGLPPTCRHCGLATGTTDPCCSASLGLSDDTEAAEPDYWLSLAADLRRVADRIASLAGTPAPDIYPTLSVHVGLYVAAGHEERRPMVDAIAAALDAPPADVMSGPFWERRARGQLGALRVTASTRIPAPEDAELVTLRAEVAALRAQLAEGGAR
ncbi:hypothetical protein [Salinispora pacifica]|uniref:hypothetical protein n=1 Tax=Salinispora pacifica TaxID=351187 RepID=UPI0005B79BD0|nr:hypothetical protein [Salinispora pacifica]